MCHGMTSSVIIMDKDFKKFNERIRSKNNRQQFRSLIDNINRYIHNEKLNTNRCLSMITSTFQLQKFLAKTKCKELLDLKQVVPLEDLDVEVDVEKIDDTGSSLQFQTSQNSKEETSQFLNEKFSINLIMNIWNLTGIGFDEKGKIMYTSSNLLKRLGLTEPIVGENLSILTSNTKDILSKVFVDGIMRWVGYLDVHRASGKDTVSILCNGKILQDSDG